MATIHAPALDLDTTGWSFNLGRWRLWHATLARLRGLAHHPDPLVEASNWVALLIGTHLPFWPFYIWCSAGAKALPSALLSVAMAPIFCVLPVLSRRSGLWGRLAMVMAGIGNTIFTLWILGDNSGSDLFFAPCAALAAILFRHNERWLMLTFTSLPLVAWLILQAHPIAPLHHYDSTTARELFILNVISVSVLLSAFGWFQLGIYRRMEEATGSTLPQAGLLRP